MVNLDTEHFKRVVYENMGDYTFQEVRGMKHRPLPPLPDAAPSQIPPSPMPLPHTRPYLFPFNRR